MSVLEIKSTFSQAMLYRFGDNPNINAILSRLKEANGNPEFVIDDHWGFMYAEELYDEYNFVEPLSTDTKPTSIVYLNGKEIWNNLINETSRTISWSTEDFESKAIDIETAENMDLFDRSKFIDALNLMINNHDANIGINWNVIEDYLRAFCYKEGVSMDGDGKFYNINNNEGDGK